MKRIFNHIRAIAVICLAALVGATDSATAAAQHDEYRLADCIPEQDCNQLMRDLEQVYNQLLNLARGIQNKATADAAAALWEDLAMEANILDLVLSANAEVETAGLEAEVARLKNAYYFNSEELAFVLAGDPACAYPCVPATPEVSQLFTAAFKSLLTQRVGENNLSGGPGYSPETAWVINLHPENEEAIERYITRKRKLNYSPGMSETAGMRFNMAGSGRQRMEEGTYLFHIYRVVPNGASTAYQLKQYYRITEHKQKSPH